MNRSKDIHIELINEADWQRLLYQGPINEDTKTAIQEISHNLGKKLVIDLEGVSFLNSCGVRDWSMLIRELKQNREIELDRCPDDVVRTMNMVINFHSDLPVRSVFRAYVCTVCDYEEIRKLDVGSYFKTEDYPKASNLSCARCYQAMEPIERDEEYFLFLKP